MLICPNKRKISLLRYIQIFTNTYEVTMQVKRGIGKVILHKPPIHNNNEYMWLCWVSTLFGMICLFSKCNKSSATRFRSIYITFYLYCKYGTVFLCPFSSQWSVSLKSAEKTFMHNPALNLIFSNLIKIEDFMRARSARNEI